MACSLDCLGVGVEGEHARRLGGEADRESTVPAAQLENKLIVEIAESTQRCEVSAFRVDDAAHPFTGLYALRVVPRAPNFCAFWRVSSNFERA